MFTTARLIIVGVQVHSPVSHGDLLLVSSAAAALSTTNVTSSCPCNSEAGTNSVSSSSAAFFITAAFAEPHAIKITFFDFRMVLIPIVIARRGTCDILANSYELAIRVELSSVINLVLE